MSGFGQLGLRKTFNRELTLTVLVIAISQFNFGFDTQGFATTQALDSFAKQFGVWNPVKRVYELNTVWVSFFNGFTYFGQATGVLLGSYISKRFGRRMCMFTMSIWACICATIVITSTTSNQILVGRVLNYVYIGMELAVVPVFQSEITPQQARGFIVGTYQLSLYFGGLVVTIIVRGTGTLSGPESYLIPYGLFYIVPTFVICCIWFVPESPRWLVMKGYPEKAMRSLRRLRIGKHTDEQIEAEYKMILRGIEQEEEKGTFADIFRGAHLRRTAIVVGANFFFQATGQNFLSVYGALFAKSLGTINPFTVSLIIAVVNVLTSIVAMILTDKLGRRSQLFLGATIQLAGLMTMGGLGTASPLSHDVKSGIVAMMVVSALGYALGWAPSGHILTAEIPSTRTRDMTYRTGSVLNIATQCAVTVSLPYLLNTPYAALGSKVGFIFGSLTVASLVFVFFCVPDVAGCSLEEIDHLFEARTPTNKFKSARLDFLVEGNGRETVNSEAEQVQFQAKGIGK